MTMSGNFAQAVKPFLLGLLLVSTFALAASKEDNRNKVRKQSEQVLSRLYAVQPGARAVIASSKGYATFSRWGLNLGAVGGSIGKGLLVTQPSGDETFMRFVEGSAGLGFGIKKYDLIFVFQDQKAITQFMTKGWEAGGKATMAAKGRAGGKAVDGAFSVSPGVWVYQNTDKGLAAELTITGTKYYRDPSLN